MHKIQDKKVEDILEKIDGLECCCGDVGSGYGSCIKDEIKKTLLSYSSECEQRAREEIKEIIDKAQRKVVAETGGHEFIDTCKLYIPIQKLEARNIKE